MLYLNEEHCKEIEVDWSETISIIKSALTCFRDQQFAQPIKPYLRYRDNTNRIIAMPAYVGGEFNVAGIKWIASFPKNIEKNKPRAHSVVILNCAESGEPVCILNGAYLSILRTVSISGLIIKHYLERRNGKRVRVGIIGYGPIGQYHNKLINEYFSNEISEVIIYDKRPIPEESIIEGTKVSSNWEGAYLNSDIVITSTVASQRYINKPPKSGSLLLNVSLRDYKSESINIEKDLIVVDDWEEVAREKTDIENLIIERGLTKEQCINLQELILHNGFDKAREDASTMVNPMGLAIFDVAIANYYHKLARLKNIGVTLK